MILKTILLLSLGAVLACAAPPPSLVSLSIGSNKCAAVWMHPTAKRFEIRISSPSATNASFAKIERPGEMAGPTFRWTFQVNTKEAFECQVRAVSSSTTNATEWSNALGSQPESNLPPDPLDKKRWTLQSMNTLGVFTSASGVTNKLYLTWDYWGEVTPSYEFKVYQSPNLRDWSLIGNLPAKTTNKFEVPMAPYAFFKVSLLSNTVPPGVEIWNAITNLVMDP
jgi:hypothetical protein